MKRNLTTRVMRSILLLAVAVFAFLLFSPYKRQKGFPYRLVEHTVVIDAPADSVFRFLGNSANARRWSVFVHHISTLNAAEVPDGRVGSRRRCFCKPDESGTRWDEVITEVVPDRKRQISCYDLAGFPIMAEGLGTEQLYTPLAGGKCSLRFTLFFMTKRPTLLEELKIRVAGYKVKNVFSRNMANIKRIVEAGA